MWPLGVLLIKPVLLQAGLRLLSLLLSALGEAEPKYHCTTIMVTVILPDVKETVVLGGIFKKPSS